MVPFEYLQHTLVGVEMSKHAKKEVKFLQFCKDWDTKLSYLVHQSLVLGFLMQLGDVGDDHRNDQVQLGKIMFAMQI